MECGPHRAGGSGEMSSSNPGRTPPESQQPWERSTEIPRSKEHRSNRGRKRQTEASCKRKLCGTQYVLWRGHGKVVPLWAVVQGAWRAPLPCPKVSVTAGTKRRNQCKGRCYSVNLSDPNSINQWDRRDCQLFGCVHTWIFEWTSSFLPAGLSSDKQKKLGCRNMIKPFWGQ